MAGFSGSLTPGTFPPTLDLSVTKIRREYDKQGRIEVLTSFSPGDQVVSRIQRVYTRFGNLDTEFQTHTGLGGLEYGSDAVRYRYENKLNRERLVGVRGPENEETKCVLAASLCELGWSFC